MKKNRKKILICIDSYKEKEMKKKNEMSQEVKEATRKHYFKIARKWIELVIIIMVSIAVSVVAWNYMTIEMETTDRPSLIVIATGIMVYCSIKIILKIKKGEKEND